MVREVNLAIGDREVGEDTIRAIRDPAYHADKILTSAFGIRARSGRAAMVAWRRRRAANPFANRRRTRWCQAATAGSMESGCDGQESPTVNDGAEQCARNVPAMAKDCPPLRGSGAGSMESGCDSQESSTVNDGAEQCTRNAPAMAKDCPGAQRTRTRKRLRFWMLWSSPHIGGSLGVLEVLDHLLERDDSALDSLLRGHRVEMWRAMVPHHYIAVWVKAAQARASRSKHKADTIISFACPSEMEARTGT
ncbi:hypothetical protein DFH06DRAFT_1152703 [Mycena polygramma]|nr:hypothetical protein DFH06DRAFT_1152703 [Mycena polygramma]